MIKESSIYIGNVIHKRFKPKIHFFKYKVFSILLDLSEINLLNTQIWMKYNFFAQGYIHQTDRKQKLDYN